VKQKATKNSIEYYAIKLIRVKKDGSAFHLGLIGFDVKKFDKEKHKEFPREASGFFEGVHRILVKSDEP